MKQDVMNRWLTSTPFLRHNVTVHHRFRNVFYFLNLALFAAAVFTFGISSASHEAIEAEILPPGDPAGPYREFGYPWENNDLGISDRIPAPWTDLGYSEGSIRCWGREFILSGTPLPPQIKSQEEVLFSAPPSVELRVNGCSTPAYNRNWVSRGKNRATYRLEAQGDDYRVEWDVSLEYDGFLRLDAAIVPQKELTIDRLALRFPFTRRTAQFFSRFLAYDFNTQRMSRKDFIDSFGRIDGPVSMGFTPALWIGNHEVGMEWVCETNHGWTPRASTEAMQILPQAETVLLEIRFVVEPVLIKTPYRLSFALYPTPVKPLPAQWRNIHLVPYTAAPPPLSDPETHRIFGVARLDEFSTSYPGLPVIANRFRTNPAPDDDKEARAPHRPSQLRRRGHTDRGRMGFIPYGSLYGMPPKLPHDEWKDYAGRWRVMGPEGFSRNRIWARSAGIIPGEPSIWSICPYPKSFKDFFIWYHFQAAEKREVDGIYLDQAAPNVMCRNASHPHGAYAENGSAYYPLFEQRELLKRLYTACKAANPHMVIVQHHTKVPAVCAGFSEMIISGEALEVFFRQPHWSRAVADTDPSAYVPDYSRVPQTVFEIQFSQNRGAIQVLLPQIVKSNRNIMRKDRPRFEAYTRGMMSRAAVYDIPVFPLRMDPEVYGEFLSAQKRFGWLGDADYFGPWTSFSPAVSHKEGLKSAIYWKPKEKKAMIILSNFTPNPINDRVAFNYKDFEQLGISLPRDFGVMDAESGLTISVADGRWEVNIPANDFRILLLQ
jgi:hypothetical protein